MKNLYVIDGIEELSIQEQKNANGGSILAVIALGLGILGGVCLLAYGAGYVYGEIEQALNEE